MFDTNALWLSMLIGALGYKWLLPLKPTLPVWIFFMLFFTFCKVNPLDLRLRRWHWAVLVLQLVLSFATYYGLMVLTGNTILAQGLMLCFIMPTATAAPIIAGKLGGSIQNLTAFTLLSNFATSIVVPATFPLIYPAAGMTFLNAFLLLLSRISPLLIGPFFAAWLLRISYNYYQRRKNLSASETRGLSVKRSFSASGLSGEAGHKKEFELPKRWAQTPFYLWVASILVLTATVTETVLSTLHSQLSTILWLLLGSFFACLLQFGLGKYLGYHLPAMSKGRDYQDVLINPAAAPKTMAGVSSITAGQAFGQKNTSLGVWMAQTYLDPLSSLGAAAYIIWQNVFNSLQLAFAAHKK
ncbi:MAG: hypothetical protein J5761_00250 [Paludibacteraceae bacterium]|nr:hypothetical protein [Paludibacteraceae bacterium]